MALFPSREAGKNKQKWYDTIEKDAAKKHKMTKAEFVRAMLRDAEKKNAVLDEDQDFNSI